MDKLSVYLGERLVRESRGDIVFEQPLVFFESEWLSCFLFEGEPVLCKVVEEYGMPVTGYARGTEYTEAYAYDKYGKVSSVTQSGAVTRTYTYAYKDNAARELESITTGAYKFSPQTDKLGRNAAR